MGKGSDWLSSIMEIGLAARFPPLDDCCRLKLPQPYKDFKQMVTSGCFPLISSLIMSVYHIFLRSQIITFNLEINLKQLQL
jgi:hypothetical protein